MLTLVMATVVADSNASSHSHPSVGSRPLKYAINVTSLESTLSKSGPPKSFIMRTYVKSQNNPFKMRTYKKTPGEGTQGVAGSRFASPSSTAMERAIKSTEMTNRLRLFRRTTIPSSPAKGPSRTRALRPTFK